MSETRSVKDAFDEWYGRRSSWTAEESTRFFSELDQETAVGVKARIAAFELTRNVLALEEQPGQQLDHYGLVEIIGRGSAAVVWKAVDRNNGNEVALKLLSFQRAMDQATNVRLHREAAILAQLSHPGIVRFLALGDFSSRPFLVVELVDPPRTLTDYLGESDLETRSIEDVVRLFINICRALHHAHTNGVIHRDLSPNNVLMDPLGRPKLTDFGLAIRPSDPHLTIADQVIGTPYYMSPEHAYPRRGPITARSDIFAVGIMLFEALTDEVPFGAVGLRDPKVDLLKGDPPLAHVRNSAVPVRLSRIVDATMEHAIARRYTSAEQLADDLESYLAQKRPVGAPFRLRSKFARYQRRHRWALPSVVAIAAAAILTVVGARALQVEKSKTTEVRSTLRVERYKGRLADAAAAIGRGASAQAREYLDEAPTSLRGWEWLHLWRRAYQAGEISRAAMGRPMALVASSRSEFAGIDASGRFFSLDADLNDDKWLGDLERELTCAAVDDTGTSWLTVDTTGRISVSDSAGTLSWTGTSEPIQWCGWMGSEAFFTCTNGGMLSIWEDQGLGWFGVTQSWSTVGPVCYHPFLKSLLTQSPNRTIRSWKRDGTMVSEFDPACGPISRLIPKSDSGDVLILDQAGSLFDYDIASGAGTLVPTSLGGRTTAVAVAGKLLAYADATHSVVIRRGVGEPETRLVGAASRIVDLAISEDRRWICGATDDGARLAWLTVPSSPTPEVLKLKGPPASMVAHPTRSLLAVGTSSEATWLLDTWDGGLEQRFVTQKGAVSAIGFALAADVVATGGPAGGVELYDTSGRRTIQRYSVPGPVRSLAVSPQGRALAAVTSAGQLWVTDALADGASRSAFTTQVPLEKGERARACAFTEDGSIRFIVEAQRNDASAWRLLALSSHNGDANSPEESDQGPVELLSGEGHLIAVDLKGQGASIVASDEHRISVFDAETGEWIANFKAPGSIVDVAVAPLSQRVFVAMQNQLSIWSLSGGNTCLYRHPTKKRIKAIECSSASTTRVFVADESGSIQAWCGESSLPIALLETSAHEGRLRPQTELARVRALGDPVLALTLLEAAGLHKADRGLAVELLRNGGAVTARELNDAAWKTVRSPGGAPDDLVWAERAAMASVERDPGNRFAWHTLGLARIRTGAWSGASNALREASRLDCLALKGTPRASTLAYLALALDRLGEHEEAADTLRQAEALSRQTPRPSTKEALVEVRHSLSHPAPSAPGDGTDGQGTAQRTTVNRADESPH